MAAVDGHDMRFGVTSGRLPGTLLENESPRPDCYACDVGRMPSLTCGSLFRVDPAVHGRFWLARGFLVGLPDASPEGPSCWQIEGGRVRTLMMRRALPT